MLTLDKHYIASCVLRSIKEEKLKKKDVAKNFNVLGSYFSSISREDYWRRVPIKLWIDLRNWIDLDIPLKDYSPSSRLELAKRNGTIDVVTRQDIEDMNEANELRITNVKHGAIRRWKRTAKGIRLRHNGYYEYTIGINKGRSVHDVVMEQIIGRKLTSDEIVHHKNEIRTDNDPGNLQLMTRVEHSRFHAKKNQARGICYDISKETKHGEDSSSSKLKESEVLQILNDQDSQRKIALKYGVTISCIKNIKSRRNWKHIIFEI